MQNIQFTEDYDLSRLTHSDTATRLNIKEQWEPPRAVIDNLTQLAKNILQPLNNALGCDYYIPSAYRCARVNKLVGGASSSQHLLGQASDNILTIKGVNKNLWMAQTVLNAHLPFDQMILEGGTILKPRWIHLSYSNRNRRQILQADFSSGKAVYSVLNPEDVLNAK